MKNQNTIDPETEFPKVEKLLYRLAWKFVAQCPRLEFEDAKSIAFLAFAKACESFDPDRGMKFSSYVHQVVWFRLKSHVMERAADPVMLASDAAIGTFNDDDGERENVLDMLLNAAGKSESPAPVSVHDLVCDLPHDCRELVRMLCDVPEELLGIQMTPGQFFKRVKTHLVSRREWTHDRVESACATLKHHLNSEAWA